MGVLRGLVSTLTTLTDSDSINCARIQFHLEIAKGMGLFRNIVEAWKKKQDEPVSIPESEITFYTPVDRTDTGETVYIAVAMDETEEDAIAAFDRGERTPLSHGDLTYPYGGERTVNIYEPALGRRLRHHAWTRCDHCNRLTSYPICNCRFRNL
jgi:hypothetical protein